MNQASPRGVPQSIVLVHNKFGKKGTARFVTQVDFEDLADNHGGS